MTYAIIAVSAVLWVIVTAVLFFTAAAFKRALNRLELARDALEDAQVTLAQLAVAYVYPDWLSQLLSQSMVVVDAAVAELNDEADDEEDEEFPEPFVHATPEQARIIGDSVARLHRHTLVGKTPAVIIADDVQ